MFQGNRRVVVVYQGSLPLELTKIVNKDSKFGLAKDGLCDWPPIRAFRAILNIEWNNQPTDQDRLDKLIVDLALLKRAGLILDFESLR